MAAPPDLRPAVIHVNPDQTLVIERSLPTAKYSNEIYQPTSLLDLIRHVAEMNASGLEVISLAGGLPYPERLTQLWTDYYANAQAELIARGIQANEVLQYGGAIGNERMRTWAAKETSKLTGQPVTPNEVLTVPGLQLGISETILKLCAREKKVLLTQIPTYGAFLEAAEDPIDVPVFAVESDNQGMIPESLEATIIKLLEQGIKPGMVYGMVIGNPNGIIMSDERGRQLNEICKQYSIPFYVDYAYYKLKLSTSAQPEPCIDYLDENIILAFTTSKMAAPGKRVAWEVIKGKALREKLLKTKQSQLILSAPDNELEFWQLAERSDFEEQLQRLVGVYETGINAGLEAVEENSDIFQKDEVPGGGMFLWIRVPEKISTYAYVGEILDKYHIAYCPGYWSQPGQIQLLDGSIIGPKIKDNYMRLCVVTEKPEVVKEAIRTLAKAFREIAQREEIPLFTAASEPSSGQIFASPN